jgi:hypothetical protein
MRCTVLPFKAETRVNIFKNSVRTAKKTPHFTVTKINRLTLFKEIIAVYCENRIKRVYTVCGQHADLVNVKAGCVCGYRWSLEGNKIGNETEKEEAEDQFW